MSHPHPLFPQEVDVGAGFFTVLSDRSSAVDYSAHLGADTYTVLMRTPRHFSKADSLIAPFSRQVWLAILAACLLMGPALWVFVNRLRPIGLRAARADRANRDDRADRADRGQGQDERLPLRMCYWFVYGALLKQGFTTDPKSGNEGGEDSQTWI